MTNDHDVIALAAQLSPGFPPDGDLAHDSARLEGKLGENGDVLVMDQADKWVLGVRIQDWGVWQKSGNG